VKQGDTDTIPVGGGTGGARSLYSEGQAILATTATVIEKGRKAASEALEAAPADIAFEAGRFSIVGTDRGIGIMDLAARLRTEVRLPDDVPRTLDVSHIFKGVPSAFPNGCHIAEVELDPDTGMVEIVSYTTVNDFGVLVNPMLVAGQAHGGIAQGIGQALIESVVYDEDGQVLTGSFMDYGLPRAADLPGLGFESHPVPARTNPLGAKGCGEAGCAGSLPAVMNALVDALSEFGITHIDMPATPHRIWQAIQAARAAELT
jgi:aerobic carbon-monoxide dehydrogenase large subunit